MQTACALPLRGAPCALQLQLCQRMRSRDHIDPQKHDSNN
jgi:hypothetical protein